MNYKKRDERTRCQRIENFVNLGEEKYGAGRYDYSLAAMAYINNRTPVPLICNVCKSKGFTEPFMVLPFRHTEKGGNQRGSCPKCYVPQNRIQELRWDLNRLERVHALIKMLNKRHGEKYSYPYIEDEFVNEKSRITVVCNQCDHTYTRKVAAMKRENRPFACVKCNARTMKKTIQEKNSARQKRNYEDAYKPKPYGCIYKITNQKNEKFYIGYSTMSAKRRFKSHCDEVRRLEKGYKKAKSYLHNAMSYHGLENYTVEIIKEFTDIPPLLLGKYEKYFIKTLNPHYNVSPGGELANYRGNKKQTNKEQ